MDIFSYESARRIGDQNVLRKVDALMDWSLVLPLLKSGLNRVCCQGFSDWRGFFLTEALVQFLFEFRLQRIDVASVVSGVSVF